jgi:hypothetical protein
VRVVEKWNQLPKESKNGQKQGALQGQTEEILIIKPVFGIRRE